MVYMNYLMRCVTNLDLGPQKIRKFQQNLKKYTDLYPNVQYSFGMNVMQILLKNYYKLVIKLFS